MNRMGSVNSGPGTVSPSGTATCLLPARALRVPAPGAPTPAATSQRASESSPRLCALPALGPLGSSEAESFAPAENKETGVRSGKHLISQATSPRLQRDSLPLPGTRVFLNGPEAIFTISIIAVSVICIYCCRCNVSPFMTRRAQFLLYPPLGSSIRDEVMGRAADQPSCVH